MNNTVGWVSTLCFLCYIANWWGVVALGTEGVNIYHTPNMMLVMNFSFVVVPNNTNYFTITSWYSLLVQVAIQESTSDSHQSNCHLHWTGLKYHPPCSFDSLFWKLQQKKWWQKISVKFKICTVTQAECYGKILQYTRIVYSVVRIYLPGSSGAVSPMIIP